MSQEMKCQAVHDRNSAWTDRFYYIIDLNVFNFKSRTFYQWKSYNFFDCDLLSFIIPYKRQQRQISTFKRKGMTNTANSLLFTSMNVLPKMHPNRGERNAVLINNHLPIFNEGHLMSFTLVVSPSSNTLMRNSLTLFILFVLMIYDAKEAYRCAKTTHTYRL